MCKVQCHCICGCFDYSNVNTYNIVSKGFHTYYITTAADDRYNITGLQRDKLDNTTNLEFIHSFLYLFHC